MIKKFLPILILILLLFPLVAQAQGFFSIIGNILQDILCLLTGIACPDPCLRLIAETGGTASYGLCKLVDRIAGALYTIGWGIAFVIIIWSGINIMVAGGNEEQVKKGKQILKNGLIGAAIILCSGFILSLLVDFLAPLFYY